MKAAEAVSDSYGSWSLAIRAWREIRVRSGEYEPKTETEHRWASEGPCNPRDLDTTRDE